MYFLLSLDTLSIGLYFLFKSAQLDQLREEKVKTDMSKNTIQRSRSLVSTLFMTLCQFTVHRGAEVRVSCWYQQVFFQDDFV